MTDESRKQAEAILNKTLEDNCFWLSDTEGNAIVKAMESYAALKVAEATKEMYLNMQYYMEYCQMKGYVTPQEWIEKHKHF